MKSRLARSSGPAALVIASLALVLSFTGGADAARSAMVRAFAKPKANAVLKLNSKKRFPASVIPKVRAARDADTVGGVAAEALQEQCNTESVDLGTFCLSSATFALPAEEVGKNNFFFASQKCVELGGYLPTAAQLIGAAPRIKLASTIEDSELTSSKDVDASDGLRDRREMSSTLITTQAGSSAAGSLGVSDGSKGDPKQGEADPAPQPAVPAPETLQYVTVYDNGEKGGFAGSRPVSQPEQFRCAFNKQQGLPAEEAG